MDTGVGVDGSKLKSFWAATFERPPTRIRECSGPKVREVRFATRRRETGPSAAEPAPQKPARLLVSASQDARVAAGAEPGRPAPGTEVVVL